MGHGQTVTQRGSFEKEEALEALDEAEQRLAAASVPDKIREQVAGDLEAVRSQLTRPNANVSAARAIIAGIADIEGVAGALSRLTDLLS